MLLAQRGREVHLLDRGGCDGDAGGNRQSVVDYTLRGSGRAACRFPLESVRTVPDLLFEEGWAKEGHPDLWQRHSQDEGRYGEGDRFGCTLRGADLPIARFGGGEPRLLRELPLAAVGSWTRSAAWPMAQSAALKGLRWNRSNLWSSF